MGFEIRFLISPDLDESAIDVLIDTFLEQAIEANGLVFGGGGKSAWDGVVTLEQRGSVTEEHRQLVQQWLASQPQILEYDVGPPVDAWYPA
jgi:uncharacterized protein YggL (DUF469 family)